MIMPLFPDFHSPYDGIRIPKNRGTARYAVGLIDSQGSYGMVKGPYDKLMDALNYCPLSRKMHFVFHCDNFDIIPLYRWHRRKEIWRKLKSKRIWVFHAESDCFGICTYEEFQNKAEDLTEIGPAETYLKEELRNLLIDTPLLLSIYDAIEGNVDIPF